MNLLRVAVGAGEAAFKNEGITRNSVLGKAFVLFSSRI